MHPRLITTPYFTLHTFGVLLALAFLASLLWAMRTARKQGLDTDRMASLCLWAIVGSILGAKLLMILRSASDYIADPSLLWSVSTLQSAGDFYGGFLGALGASALFFLRHRDVPVWAASDACGPSIALGQAIGRIGCLMAGDDYGKPARVPWAIRFSHPDAAHIGGAPLDVPLHPVQIYESILCFAIFLFLVWLFRRKRFDGQIILAYSLLYAGARFFVEFYRGDADRGFVFGGLLSTSQFIAILVAAVAAVLWWMRSRVPAAPAAPPPRKKRRS